MRQCSSDLLVHQVATICQSNAVRSRLHWPTMLKTKGNSRDAIGNHSGSWQFLSLQVFTIGISCCHFDFKEVWKHKSWLIVRGVVPLLILKQAVIICHMASHHWASKDFFWSDERCFFFWVLQMIDVG